VTAPSRNSTEYVMLGNVSSSALDTLVATATWRDRFAIRSTPYWRTSAPTSAGE
jgi:hypothetical protein